MNQELPHETIPVLLRRRTKEISGRELVGWAEQALVDDFDSPALSRLAGLDMDGSAALRREEALLLFRRALDELGCVVPSEDDVVRLYVAGVARRILDGDLSPREGASKIHEDVLTPP